MGRRRAATVAAKAADTSFHEPSGDASPAGSGPAGRHFGPRKKTPLWLKITAVALSAVIVLGVGTAGLLFLRLQHNVTTAPLNAAVAPHGTSESTGSLQILILGTDTRAGKNSEYGTLADSAGEGHSDVMLLVNISADNSQVSVTSFPRDLMVPIPACKSVVTGEVVPAQPMGQLNSALAAGPGCTVAAINAVTGLTIDHFMLADFSAVKELSTALGGVQVCVDHAMYDVDGSFLKLPKGKSLVSGEQALAFLRTRHAFGDASDLARIKAQQYFLGSMVRKIKSEGTLNNLPQLYRLADVVTKNLTIDEGLANIPSMIDIATRLSKIDPANVAFVTVPNEPWVQDPNRVELKEPDAGQFFSALRADTALTKPAPKPEAVKTATGAPSTAPSTPPATTAAGAGESVDTPPAVKTPSYDKAVQPVSVANASAVPGRDAELIQELAKAGFTQSVSGGDVAAQNTTQVLYGPDMQDVAKDIAALFKIPAAHLKADPTITGVQLVVGTDWTGGASYGKVIVPKDIVSSTAAESNECLVVNPLYYTN